ncbi:MAG: hypothetical protein JW940_08860 [Polyangiaceae bacterium]|nr:hypothetical protein [Polyangiaceae bacterium]
MRCSHLCALAATATLTFACGGSQQTAESPDEYGVTDELPESENHGSADVEQPDLAEEQKDSDQQSSDAVKEPEFKEGMSVNDAINAVPAGTPGERIDPETLSIPLKDSALYAPCKISASQHFTLNVAVWDGRAVGMDIKTQPNNPTLEACLRQQVSQVVWRERAKGINTVEYSF